MPRPHNTHSATMSCRLPSPIMSATTKNYWRTCSMRCNHTWIRLAVMHCISLSSLSMRHTFHPLNPRLGAARDCRVVLRVWKTQMCGNNGHPHSIIHLHFPPLSRTKGRCHGEEKPAAQRIHEGTCNSNAIHAAPHDSAMRTADTRPQRKKRIQIHGAALYFSLPQRIGVPHSQWGTAHTIRSPPSALSRPAPSHPRPIAMGNTNNRRRGPSVPLAGRREIKEMRTFQKHKQQRDAQ
ncbi:hypothetical protein TCDM_12186 [Trypanosoma cruzi Dm28c]|uniref:Uncharacterized protein n=1 Tax=Trypanosoma cruzi Dm28c TaxID=1416333 RepID=V5CYF6_TRYCR|nr:hypothetical protein TCDM_12186 [Trypanosoma cruzi Dm28c]